MSRLGAVCLWLALGLWGAPAGAQDAARFVSEATCKNCHQAEHEAWQGSHHAKAMDHASEATVLGDFDDATFEHFGVTSRFYRKDGGFFVETEGPDGALTEYEIAYVFGVDPLQQYLIAFPDGRYQALSIVWDVERKRWYHLYPNERIAPDDPLHWTGTYQNWNMMCGECHTTNYAKNYDLASGSYETTYSQINVGCQACHGPAGDHLRWAASGARTSTPMPPFSSLMGAGQAGQVGQCAQCHARRAPTSARFTHDLPFLDQFHPAMLRPELYHSDGQILDEVYVYGSFLQSKMHAAGVTCSNCHDPHAARLKADGNAVCTQCHSPAGNADFPTLTLAEYDTPAHHHHTPGSAGAQCTSCHMPERNYMVIDGRRDHSFRIPRPDLSTRIGTPNACTDCHTDQTAEWASEQLTAWGVEPAIGPDYAELAQLSRAGAAANVRTELLAYLDKIENPGIRRATLVEEMPLQSREDATKLLGYVFDPDPMVRAAALDRTEDLPPALRHQAALQALSDDSRLVRLRAAKIAADMDLARVPPAQQTALMAAFKDYESSLETMADSPSGRFNLAVFHARRGNNRRAEAHYGAAIKLDPSFLPARFNYANLLSSNSNNRRAEAVLRGGLRWAPTNGQLHYSLGLLLAEEGRFDEAAQMLEKATAFEPGNIRGYYNHALVLQQLNRWADSRAVLMAARGIAPADLDIANALMHVSMRLGDWRAAQGYLRQLQAAYPGDPALRNFEQIIDSQLGGG